MLNDDSKINVIIANDHFLFREGFKAVFKKQREIKIIAEASNGKELLALVEKHLPHVVVTDVAMAGLNGIDATRLIKKNFPEVGIIALSAHDNQDSIFKMFEAGANSYLLKDSPVAEITKAIQIARQGSFYYHSSPGLGMNDNSKKRASFSERELEVLQLMFKECTSKEIAAKLYLSDRTIEDHRKHIQKKMGVKNLAGMLLYALKYHLIEIDGF
jgi:DNA-binding NarL/FixJ family response regulator